MAGMLLVVVVAKDGRGFYNSLVGTYDLYEFYSYLSGHKNPGSPSCLANALLNGS